ncbi:hypothetical protein ON010_g17056 [Phytophthora cinnamomi]|nr:hypothetical protein ON010_g17056 [Phytophthora cinnamomi]
MFQRLSASASAVASTVPVSSTSTSSDAAAMRELEGKLRGMEETLAREQKCRFLAERKNVLYRNELLRAPTDCSFDEASKTPQLHFEFCIVGLSQLKMAVMFEVGDLHEHLGCAGSLQQGNESGLHPGDDDEGLGRSYVCSMSSTIDLGCQECGNCADLARSVQCYLARIVEELHLISAWSSNVYHGQQQRTESNRVSSDEGSGIEDSSFTAMARLAVVTDIELMRRDVAKAQHELFQRCTTQMAYVQNEAHAAITKQDTLVDELQQRMDDSMHSWGQQARSIQALEKARAESDGQIRAMLRQIQQQIAAHPARMSELEKSLATVATAQFAHEQELQALQRRIESHETAHQLQLESTRRAAEDAVAALRSSHSQLSSKMQVLRLELQDSSDTSQKRMQQILKVVSSVATSMSGKPMFGPNTAVPPRRPSVATPRTPRSGANTAPNQLSSGGGPGNSSDTLDDILDGGKGTQAVMTTGANAMATSDCFIYAKAALPHRNPTADTSLLTKKTVAPTGSNRGLVSTSNLTGAGVETQTQDVMTNLLTVQQSVMSMPLGFEDDTRSAPAIDPPTANLSAVDRRDPIIPTRRTAYRHNSLPDVNLSVTQSALSPHKFQASRLSAKQK